MTLMVIVIAVIAFVGFVAAWASRWRRERRSNHGVALNRLRELAHRYGVDEDGGSQIVRLARHEQLKPPPLLRLSPHAPSGTPRHAVQDHGLAQLSLPVVSPMEGAHRSRAQSPAYAGSAPQADGPPSVHPGEAGPIQTQSGEANSWEGFRWLGPVSGVSAPTIAEQAARVTGVFDDPDAREPGVEANARLTATTGLLLVVLFFFEGLTIPVIGRFLTWHVAIGLALIPPVLLKIGSTLWRFGHYYWGDRRYVRAGPPHPMLRVLGPFVVISTVAVIASGVALWLVGPQDRLLLRVHQLTFVLWFIVVAIHLVSHLWRATRLAAADRRDARVPDSGLPGARTRRLVVAMSLVVGVMVGLGGITVTTGWSHRTAHIPGPATVVRPNGPRALQRSTAGTRSQGEF